MRRFIIRGVNADWPEQGQEKDDWNRPVMSQTADSVGKRK